MLDSPNKVLQIAAAPILVIEVLELLAVARGTAVVRGQNDKASLREDVDIGIKGESVLAVGPAMDVNNRRRRVAEAGDARFHNQRVDFPLVETLVGNHPAGGKLLRFHAAQKTERDLRGR